jgi:glutamine synthetase
MKGLNDLASAPRSSSLFAADTVWSDRIDCEAVVVRIQLLFADPGGRARQKFLFDEKAKSGFCSTVLLQALNGVNVSVPGYGAYTGHVNAYLSSAMDYLRPHWEPGLALSLADILQRDGAGHPLCSRTLLKSTISMLSRLGLKALVGLEIEFYLVPDSLAKDALSRRFFPGAIPREPYGSISDTAIEQIAVAAARSEIAIESIHREYENFQYEFALTPSDPLRAADDALIFRELARSIARKHRAWACFLPKPFTNELGSGMHINVSIHKNEPGQSDLAFPSHTAADLQKMVTHFPACCVIWNSTVNSYRRLRSADFASIPVSAAEERRDGLLRIAESPDTSSRRIEFRLPDAACNPYSSITICLSLLSIDTFIRQGASEEATSLPSSLREAMIAFKNNRSVYQIFPREFATVFLAQKDEELRHYDATVSDVDYLLHAPEFYSDYMR